MNTRGFIKNKREHNITSNIKLFITAMVLTILAECPLKNQASMTSPAVRKAQQSGHIDDGGFGSGFQAMNETCSGGYGYGGYGSYGGYGHLNGYYMGSGYNYSSGSQSGNLGISIFLKSNHVLPHSLSSHFSVGSHSLELDPFSYGTINKGYNMFLKGSYYNRNDETPFISNTFSGWNVGQKYNDDNFSDNATWSKNTHINGQELTRDEEKGGILLGNSTDSGASGNHFKFTNLSKESDISDYTKKFKESMIFTFIVEQNSEFSFSLISLTRNYFPQARIVMIDRSSQNKYREIKGEDGAYGFYSSVYYLQEGIEYLLEIGYSEELHTGPFESLKAGSFVSVISSKRESFLELLSKEMHLISYYGRKVEIPTYPNEKLEIKNADTKTGSIYLGSLNYSLTVFLNSEDGSLTLFFYDEKVKGRDLEGNQIEATVVDLKCKAVDSFEDTSGDEKLYCKRVMELEGRSRAICSLINSLQ